MPNFFMVDIEKTEMSEFERDMLKHPHIGAVILFTRNYSSPDQLRQLTQDIRSIRPDIFIVADHEGGVVQRFQRNGFRVLPAARVYGEAYDINPHTGIELARKFGKIMAEDLLSCGIDLSLSPVLDIHDPSCNVIGKLDRAFHQDPEVVMSLASAFIKGMHAAGMPSIAKHFPGHGSCSLDSHIAKPKLDTPLKELEQKDLKPFIELSKAGLLDGIMPAHIIYKAVDPNNPAGFSEIWLQDILRKKIGFEGMILSDCLGMKGADIGDMKTRAQTALKAGCDMVVICNQERELLYEVIKSVSYEQTEASAKRIEKFKNSMKRFTEQDSTDKETRYFHTQALFSDDNKEEKADESRLNKTLTI